MQQPNIALSFFLGTKAEVRGRPATVRHPSLAEKREKRMKTKKGTKNRDISELVENTKESHLRGSELPGAECIQIKGFFPTTKRANRFQLS